MKLTAGGNIFIKKIAVMFGFYSLQKKGVPKYLLYFTDIKDFEKKYTGNWLKYLIHNFTRFRYYLKLSIGYDMNSFLMLYVYI